MLSCGGHDVLVQSAAMYTADNSACKMFGYGTGVKWLLSVYRHVHSISSASENIPTPCIVRQRSQSASARAKDARGGQNFTSSALERVRGNHPQRLSSEKVQASVSRAYIVVVKTFEIKYDDYHGTVNWCIQPFQIIYFLKTYKNNKQVGKEFINNKVSGSSSKVSIHSSCQFCY